MKILVDTNILLDVLQRRAPHYDDSSRVWTLVEQKTVLGYVSAISFNNSFYVLRKQMGSPKALEAIKSIRRVFELVALDGRNLDDAIALNPADLEDGIQAAAARGVTADYLVTRDVKGFGALGVQAVTSEELLALLRV